MNNENLTLTEYEIKGILGRGTFSKVKLGINRNTKEKVAIKIIDKQFISNKNNYERIKREILILKKSNHPNIIKVHEIKEDSKNYYFILE
jgi:serine/threonine protein kinase